MLSLITLALALLTILSNANLSSYHHHNTIQSEKTIPLELLNKITLGYQNTYSAILWVQTIAYYGAFLDKSDFKYVSQLLQSITILNPKAEHAYYMAAALLPWSTHSTSLSKALVNRAILNFPKDWRWTYYRGFNAYWFDHDMKTAAKYMSLAAGLPDAHPIVASLAARMQAEGADLNTALAFLATLYNEKQDPALKKQLENQIKAIQTEKILRRVDQLLAKTPAWQHGKRDLNTLGVHFPKALPDGGHVILNAEGVPVSSISRKRFKVFVPPKRKKAQAPE